MVLEIRPSHATLAERRQLRKHARPEHQYTGYVPADALDADDTPAPVHGKIKKAIVGYQGHRHNREDMIGVTFTKGLEQCTPSAPTRRVTRKHETEGSGYGQFDAISGYGEFQAPPSEASSKRRDDQMVTPLRQHRNKCLVRDEGPKHVSSPPNAEVASDYGAFQGASAYGNFAAPPEAKAASGYGAFQGASAYGNFAAPPEAKAESGYGAFQGASAYGNFAPPPEANAGSGYGAFQGASGYGNFAAPPEAKAESGYGAFQGVSAYGNFAPPPDTKAASGYGAFQGASAYGNFAAPPGAKTGSGYGAFQGASAYGNFAAPPESKSAKPASGYGAFQGVSGYGNFAPPPEADSTPPPRQRKEGATRDAELPGMTFDVFCKDERTRSLYLRALKAVGGATNLTTLTQRIATMLHQKAGKMVARQKKIKLAFEHVAIRTALNGHEQRSNLHLDGVIDRKGLKTALASLNCALSDDEAPLLLPCALIFS
ncbi:hypothetical protein ACHHYP_14326 [Achlya hypogyna]|uniref:Uncharacterized protein n=1 Tax=Achlya hypogyna TaxID=1202772 RepID=A0A1V9YDH4_ACHHY|nr:hypothetical protein ACHHYP_14326 [Achlya hypogyna]